MIERKAYRDFQETGAFTAGVLIRVSVSIAAKSSHKARKTYISSLIDAGVNINEIRKQVGHEDERTTYRNYCFNRMPQSETENILEKVLTHKTE